MFIIASLLKVFSLALKLALDATLASASNRAISMHTLDRPFLFKIVNQLSSPLLRCLFLGSLHIVAVSVRERIEAELLVKVALQLLVLTLFFNALLDILPVLGLLSQFLLLLDLSELLHLVLVALVVLPFLLNLVHSLLCSGLGFGLRLLHVLLHESSCILASSPRVEHGALSLAHLLRKVVVKGHLGQKFVLLQVLEHYLVFRRHLRGAALVIDQVLCLA